MFFGLTNSPATFQMMMNHIFQAQVAQGWLSVYMDDIAIHTKPNEGETEEQHKNGMKPSPIWFSTSWKNMTSTLNPKSANF